MRAKFIYEFERGTDPKHTLGVGYIGKLQKWLRELDIPDHYYTITEEGIIFKRNLDLTSKNVVWLPDNLTCSEDLILYNNPISKLPNKLVCGYYLDLRYTEITEFPNDLVAMDSIYVDSQNTVLIEFIKSGKFKNKLRIWN